MVSIFILMTLTIHYVFNNKVSKYKDEQRVELYFFNSFTNKMEIEERFIPSLSNTEITLEVINLLREGPQNKSLSKTIPDSIDILPNGQIVNNTETGLTTLVLEFGDNYNNLSPVQEQVLRASLVYTMTGLGFIDDIHIYVSGRDLISGTDLVIGNINRDNLKISELIEPSLLESRIVNLLFWDNDQGGLVQEQRSIMVDPEVFIGYYVVEEIIKGPVLGGLSSNIPKETKIISVVTSNNICYVNLSKDFLSRMNAVNFSQESDIYPIVNSLTKLQGIDSVQFLIDSERISLVAGGDLFEPFVNKP